MRSSSKIVFSEAVPEDKQLSSMWGGVFFHPLFVKQGAKCLGLEGNVKSIEYDGDAIGVSNILYQKRSGIKAATIPLLFQYFGPVFYSQLFEKEFLKAVIDHYRKTCNYVYLSLTPEFNSPQAFSKDWEIRKSTTLALSETELESWGNGFRDDVRNKINKARRERVQIRKSNDLNNHLWAISYIRKGIKPPMEPSSLSAWCLELLNETLLNIYVAEIDGKEVAFRGQLIYGGFAYDWIAGSDPEFHHLGCNQLLMAEIGSELKGRGVTLWDLVDGSISGIAEFKKSFGALEYHHWQVNRSFGIRGKMFGALRRLKNA